MALFSFSLSTRCGSTDFGLASEHCLMKSMTRAAMPAAIGVAYDVPDFRWFVPPGHDDFTASPRVLNLLYTCGPGVKSDLFPSPSVDPMQMTWSSRAGKARPSLPPQLLAAAKIMMSFAAASTMARRTGSRSRVRVGNPNDNEMMSTSSSTAHWIAYGVC